MKKPILFLLFHLFVANFLSATHNRSGEIIYEQIDEKTISASIITYTDLNSAGADRDSLVICWGDGNCELLARVNGPAGPSGVPVGEALANGYLKNVYQKNHTYAALGNYRLSMTDPNRNGGIQNLLFSNTIPFYIETEVFLSEEWNSSPNLLQTPTDIAFAGLPFLHIPNAVDLDGDSIAYRMITPLQSSGIPVTGYFELTDISPGPNNTLDFNETSGLLIWDAPQQVGEYNIAIEVTTYRDGVTNGRVIRDMLILVVENQNTVPEIVEGNISFNQAPIQIEVGDTVRLNIDGMDLDAGQIIELSATSELFLIDTEPDYEVNYSSDLVGNGTFIWVPTLEQVRSQAYQVVFKVRDNLGLANYLEARYVVSDFTSKNKELYAEAKFKIFPNPTSDFIYLEGEERELQNYSIWDSVGKRIQTGQLHKPLAIDIRKFPPGIYYLQLNGGRSWSFVVE